MRIVLAHNHYQYPGGEDRVVENEAALLEAAGHQVRRFSVSNDALIGTRAKLVAAARAIHSLPVRRALSDELATFRADILHVHNIFPLLTPSVYYAAGDAGVAIVQTLHNYRLGCLNGLLFRDGSPCHDCLDAGSSWRGVIRACYRQSRAQSLVLAAAIDANRYLGTFGRVHAYIALTRFQRQLLLATGLPADRVHVKSNFVLASPGPSIERRGDYLLFVGRLSVEKGGESLIDAYRQSATALPLKVVGDGPLRDALVSRARGDARIEWLGQKSYSDVLALMREARALVIPSVAYEGFGSAVVEAYSCGVPVIASNRGAVAELVRDGETGWSFRVGDPSDLARVILEVATQDAEAKRRGRVALAEFDRLYSPEKNLEILMQIYSEARRVRASA